MLPDPRTRSMAWATSDRCSTDPVAGEAAASPRSPTASRPVSSARSRSPSASRSAVSTGSVYTPLAMSEPVGVTDEVEHVVEHLEAQAERLAEAAERGGVAG